MKVLVGLGKVLMLLFWLVVIVNVVQPFYQPFSSLLQVAGVVMAVLHVAQLGFYRRYLAQARKPFWARWQTLVFGIFYLYPLAVAVPTASVPAQAAAPSAQPEADHAAADPQQQELKLESGNAKSFGADGANQPGSPG